MDTHTLAEDIVATDRSTAVIVKNIVSHGDYFAEFYGSGATILEAAADAARQSTYSDDLFDITDSYYERRAEFRDKLAADLEAGMAYTGFGWNTFIRVA